MKSGKAWLEGTQMTASRIIGGLFLIALLVAWEIAVRGGILKPYQFPAPSKIGGAIIELANSGFPTGQTILIHTGITLRRITAQQ